jgi:DNA-binding NarL/FixJ family response regulator
MHRDIFGVGARERRPVTIDDRPVVGVASDRSLVAEAVGAALAGSNVSVVRIPWPGDRREPGPVWSLDSPPPSVGLLLCDLEASTVRTARWLVSRYPTRWLLLTDAPHGLLWGAMLEVGVAGILPSSTTIADLLDAIAALGNGVSGTLTPADRDELVEAWRRDQAERADARARMHSLTRRELEVLRLLHHGRTVRQIAELHDVAPSTVRSQVRSVLRKLGVSSQLAAAALLEKWGDD